MASACHLRPCGGRFGKEVEYHTEWESLLLMAGTSPIGACCSTEPRRRQWLRVGLPPQNLERQVSDHLAAARIAQFFGPLCPLLADYRPYEAYRDD